MMMKEFHQSYLYSEGKFVVVVMIWKVTISRSSPLNYWNFQLKTKNIDISESAHILIGSNWLSLKCDCRRNALNEVYAHAVLGIHQHVVRYYSAWAEDDYMYIQNEYCNGMWSSLYFWCNVIVSWGLLLPFLEVNLIYIGIQGLSVNSYFFTDWVLASYVTFILISGGSLSEVLETNRRTGSRMSESDFKQVLLQVAQGLRLIHTQNLVHLDIKPGKPLGRRLISSEWCVTKFMVKVCLTNVYKHFYFDEMLLCLQETSLYTEMRNFCVPQRVEWNRARNWTMMRWRKPLLLSTK